VRSLSQGASEVQDSAVLSTIVRTSGLHNGRDRGQALGRGLTGGAPQGQDSPAKRRSSEAAATTATLSTEGLKHEFALPEDTEWRGFAKRVRIGGRFNYKPKALFYEALTRGA